MMRNTHRNFSELRSKQSRAGIKAVTGKCSVSHWTWQALTVLCRVKDLEAKVTELEAETDRLSQALDAQKQATVDAQHAAAKQLEEAAKDSQRKVNA